MNGANPWANDVAKLRRLANELCDKLDQSTRTIAAGLDAVFDNDPSIVGDERTAPQRVHVDLQGGEGRVLSRWRGVVSQVYDDRVVVVGCPVWPNPGRTVTEHALIGVSLLDRGIVPQVDDIVECVEPGAYVLGQPRLLMVAIEPTPKFAKGGAP